MPNANDMNLEERLESLAKRGGDAEHLYHKYNDVKGYLKADYYPWVQANCPYFTDHGERHIQSVIETASQLVVDQKSKSQFLAPMPIFLLLSGIIWHDVGMVLTRSGHAEESAKIAEEVRRLAFPDLMTQSIVSSIVRAHSKAGLNAADQRQDLTLKIGQKSITVFPRALAAIMRFADEVSETCNRISPDLIKKVPTKSQIYWQYANCIVASKPEPSRERVVVTMRLDIANAINEYSCEDYPPLEKLALITYIVRRLEKMNNERAYCGREFGPYATRIREIEVRLSIFNGVNRVVDYDEAPIILGEGGIHSAGLPDIPILDELIKKFPNLEPSKLKGLI